MSDNGVKSIQGATGTYPALQSAASRPVAKESGNARPDSGKVVPAVEQPKVDMEAIARSLNMANKSIGNQLRFEVDLEKGRSVIQVLDRDTGEIIRQIPPEQARVVAGALDNFRLYDEQI